MKSTNQSLHSEKQIVLFGNIFLLANRLQAVSDKYLEKDRLTAKQWFLLAAIKQFVDTPPTLSEISGFIGCSRQNVKQFAAKLEEKEFLKISKDEEDTRAYRLILTDKCNSFWEEREDQDNIFITDILNCLSEKEKDLLTDMIDKILKQLRKVSEEGDLV